MLDRDFFGFCTTLKPLELKAMGRLSQVRHFKEGETVYSPGDPGDTLYIINRGVVEVVQGDKEGPESYLSAETFRRREALAELPRKYLIPDPRAGQPPMLPAQEFCRAG